MKGYLLFGIVLVVILSSCGDSKEKKEIERKDNELKEQHKKLQREHDSLKFEKAIALYTDQSWEEAANTFRSIGSTEFYRKQSLEYLEKITNRPWKKSNNVLKTSVKGDFSNSATKDSSLWVEMEFKKNGDINLYLYEYSESKPSNRSAEKPLFDFSIFVSGHKTELLGYKIRPGNYYSDVNDASHSEGIRLTGNLAKKVVDTLIKSSDMVYFSITMGSSSTYNFWINTDGFTKEFNSL